jgi:DNA-binding transcriptional ArsR family regulator
MLSFATPTAWIRRLPDRYRLGQAKRMMRIRLTGADLGRIRFGVSPLFETVRCLRVLRNPGAHAIHLSWVRWAAPRLPRDPDVTLLRKLTTVEDAVPVSIVPPPDSRMPTLAAELTRVRHANPDRVRQSLRSIFGERRWLDDAYADPTRMMHRVADAIERCHEALIAPHWARMRGLLDADIEFRARTLSGNGVEAVISGINPEVRWDDGDVLVWARNNRFEGKVVMSGQGLVLSPSIFGWPGCTSSMRPAGAATIRYPARGIGTLWETPGRASSDAIAELLGSTRAGILDALSELSDTPMLAKRLGVTPGAVSQHLRVLREAGLVRTQRTGRTALHLRTAKAEALLGEGPQAPRR